MALNNKNKQIVNLIIKTLSTLDPGNPTIKKYKNFFAQMSDKDFDKYMKHLKNKDTQIFLEVPNMKRSLKMENVIQASKEIGVKLFQRLWMVDKTTGKKFLTPEAYPVFLESIRVMEQFVDKKLSVSEGDEKIDGLTGQVVGDDKSSAVSAPEIQSLFAQGLETTLKELVKVRGGDVNAYAEFKRQMEETGTARLDALSPSKTRSVVMTDVIFRSMGLESNFSEG